MSDCDCTEEYGPCEQHGQVLAQREGASLRTADELCAVYIDDALDIDPQCLSPYGREVLKDANKALSEASWIDDPDLADGLRDVVTQVESYLDAVTYWDDGYRIVKITGGPLLDD